MSDPTGSRSSFFNRFERLWNVDLRSLALFRIALASAILLDLISRAVDLSAHYTDAGVLPRAILANGLRPSIGSLIAVSWPGSSTAAALFMIIFGVAAFALAVGFRTRTATVICWVCTLALLARNPLVLHRADTLIKMLLFWGMFLPLGARWSLDAALCRARPERPVTVRSMATVALLLQPCLMYWFAVLSRSPREWWVEASALYYALNCDVIVRPVAEALREFPTDTLAGLTRLVVVMEAGIPLLLWIPFATARVRVVALGLLMLMPTLFGLTFSIGFFPMMCCVAVIPFLPTEAWNWITHRWPGSGKATTGSVRLIPSWLRPRACFTPLGRVANVTVGCLLAYVVVWNLNQAGVLPMPKPVQAIGTVSGINQRWDIFAPAPPKEDRWHQVLGLTQDGHTIDLLRGRVPLGSPKPRDFEEYWGSYRWRRYWFNVVNLPPLYEHYARYTATAWNDRHPPTRHLVAMRLELISEPTPPVDDRGADVALTRSVVWPPPEASQAQPASMPAPTEP